MGGPNSNDGTCGTLCICTLWIRLIDGSNKSLRLKSNLEKDFAAAVFVFLRLSPHLNYCPAEQVILIVASGRVLNWRECH